MTSTTSPEAHSARRGAALAVDRVAGAMQRAGNNPFGLTAGDLAALRRGPRGNPSTFWRVFTRLVEPVLSPDAPASEAEATRWPAILQIAAVLEGLHARERRLGVALAEAGLSELRFERLMRADGERLADEALKAARLLASKGVSADIASFANLIRHDGDERGEEIRRRLSRDYFRTLSQHQ